MKIRCIVLFLTTVVAGWSSSAVSAQTLINEGFESGGKTAYAAANVTLGSGSWFSDDSLTGNSTSDRKTGSWAARVRQIGRIRMNFNVASAASVTVQHAKFGSDGTSTWELWKSLNDGTTWSKVGSTVITSSTGLTTATFTVNETSPVRFEIRKITGGANRINLDNFTVTAAGGGGGGSSVHLTMGNPSGATTNTSFPNNYLMIKPQYALAYSRDNGGPNWTSWHLDTTWLGTTPRQDDFRADASLPAGWYRVQGTDFSGSGYDRGHMCPSGDRTKTVADNSATFLMTNMIPQAPDNNQIGWASLESYCRTLANQGNELYIISGGNGISGFIANGHVAVPTFTWKVIMVLPSGSNDVSRVTTSTRLIAILMPNQNGIDSNWRNFRVSVDQIEGMTGFDFFSNVSPSVQNVIEAQVDSQLILDADIFLDAYALDEVAAEAKLNPRKKE